MSKKLLMSDLNTSNKQITWNKLIDDDYISPSKVAIATHKSKRKVIVGSKECGKTFIGIVDVAKSFNEDPYYNAWGFRKHLTGAAKSLGKYVYRVYSELTELKYKTNKNGYKLTQSELYHIHDKQNMLKNQVMNFSSLVDYSGTTDGKTVSKGYIGTVIVDEAVIEQDALEPDKIPSPKEWDKLEQIITSNLSRYNESYAKIKQLDTTPETTFYYFMNNWGPHPLIIEADKFYPEKDFINWVLGVNMDDLIGNEELVTALFENQEWLNDFYHRNTSSIYNKDNDTLYTRMTVFANPLILNNDFKRIGKTNQIRDALINDNREAFTMLLGLRQQPKLEDEWRVYPQRVVEKIIETTPADMIAQGYKPVKVSYGVDTDVSRVMTITPTIEYNKVTIEGLERVVLIDDIIEIPANGAGHLGSNLDTYVNWISNSIYNHTKENMLLNVIKIIIVDDNRQWFLRDISQNEYTHMYDNFEQAEKNGFFDISNRQDMFIAGIENGTIRISKGNQQLIIDLMQTIKRAIDDDRRDTMGTKNYLDRIDSMEYSLQAHAPLLWKNKGGQKW